MTLVTFTQEALEKVTPPQVERIKKLCGNEVNEVYISDPFKHLPPDYVAVTVRYYDGRLPLHGGIDITGELST